MLISKYLSLTTIVFILALFPGVAFAQNTNLLSIDTLGDQLVQFDVQDGTVSTVGLAGIDIQDFCELTNLDGNVYGMDFNFMTFEVRLLQFDLVAGSATELGTLTVGGEAVVFARGLSSNGGQLFVAYSDSLETIGQTSKLGTVSLDGEVTLIQDTGISISGQAFDSAGNHVAYVSVFDEPSNSVRADFYLLDDSATFLGSITGGPASGEIEFFDDERFYWFEGPNLYQLNVFTDIPGDAPSPTVIGGTGAYQGLVVVEAQDESEKCNEPIELNWEIGDIAPNFSAFRLNASNQPEAVDWYDELNSNADFYVISTCAMWCGPCQVFALESQTIVNHFADQGTTIEIYDFIFENPLFQAADENDVLFWQQGAWTANPENVWFGGEISDTCNIIEDIFLSNPDPEFAIPYILVLDNRFEVRAQFTGFNLLSILDVIDSLDLLLGDVNQDGVVNLLDVQPFVEVLSGGGYQQEADCNGDGVLNLLDISFFVEILSA